MMSKSKKYIKNGLTVIWQPALCVHSANCVKGLPQVFNPQQRPWIDLQQAGQKSLSATIDQCPSGALSYQIASLPPNEKENEMSNPVEITILKNGPAICKGSIVIKDADGKVIQQGAKAALCRCGGSENKPLCDGTHARIDFQG